MPKLGKIFHWWINNQSSGRKVRGKFDLVFFYSVLEWFFYMSHLDANNLKKYLLKQIDNFN